MADKTPISSLPAGAQTGANVDVDADYLAIDDVSAGNTKKITPRELVAKTSVFLQSGIGAIARNAQTKGRERKSFEDFGAVGDGVTDDAAAWATALAAMGSANFELHGTPGSTYVIGAAGVSIANKTSARIVADGAKIKVNAVATQAPAGLNSTVIFMDTNTNVEFSGWECDGNSLNSVVIGLKNNTECTVRGNRVSTGGRSGQIMALGNTRCRYLDNECISGNGSASTLGMWIGNYATGNMEADCEVAGNISRGNNGTGINVSSVGGRVYGNHAQDNGGSGIIFGGNGGFASAKLAIFGNVCRGNTFSGIQCDVVGYTTVADLPYGITITGNVCEENDASGIYAPYMIDSVISANICRDNNHDASGNGYGIVADIIAQRLVVGGNYCYDTRSGASRTQTNGILVNSAVGATVDDISVTGNLCYNNLTTGISVSNSGAGRIAGLSLVGNTANDNGTNGIFIADAAAGDITELTVVGNTAVGNGTTDIRIDPPDAVISGNRFVLPDNSTLWHAFTDADTTPSVKGRSLFRFANTGATTITDFDDGMDGQEITIILDANTTITDGGSLLLAGAANYVGTSGDTLTLVMRNTTWHEKCRSVN